MTNEITAEQAIKWLKDIERSFPVAYFGEWRKALRMAIQALEAQPTHGSTYGGVSWGGTYKEETQPTDAILREIMARIEYLHDAEDIKGHIRELIEEYTKEKN